MTVLKTLLLSVLLFTPAFVADGAEQFQISGDIADLLEEGEVVLATAGDVIGEKIEIARGKISDGKFSLSGEFNEIERANVAIINADGRGQGSVDVILETDPIRVRYVGRPGGFRAEGGKYNRMLIASWEQSEEYKKSLDEFKMTAAKRDKLKEGPEKAELNKKYWELYYVMPKIRLQALDAIAISDKDPLASSLAIQLGAFGNSEKAVARLNELEKTLGPQQGLVNRREGVKGSILRRLNSEVMKKSSQGLTVSANIIAGETFELDAVLKKNEYVLLEFWASWCGPCIKEVPHMKKAYQEFNKKGFEIFSVSLDDDRERWVAASERLMPPWINVSDLKAYDSPAAIKYGVQIIPRNFLLDKQGNILASDLRGEAIAAKLKELIEN